MSADIKTVPPWKQALLEKKRRHEEDEKRRMADEEVRLSKMPAWKRDILIKKRQQKNSVVYTATGQGSSEIGDIDREATHAELELGGSDSVSPRGVPHSGELSGEVNHLDSYSEDELNMTGEAPDGHNESGTLEEHIIPIQQNPWLRTELHIKKKHGKVVGRPKENDISHSHSADNSLYHSSCGETDVASGTRHERLDDQENNGDEVFNGEEVEYGRGFVHKLLRKFTHMSAKDEGSVPIKRSNSSENILDELRGRSTSPSPRSRSVSGRVDHARSLSPASPAKARSMENISSHLPNLDRGRHDQRNSLHVGDGHHKSRPVSMGHEVSNHLPHLLEYHNEDDVIPTEPLRKSHSADNILEDELPRPNTVSAARSLFEHASGSTLPARYTDTLSKKRGSPRSPKNELPTDLTDSRGQDGSPQSNGSGVINKLDSVNHIHDKFGQKAVNDRTLQNIRAAGKSWTFGENGGPPSEGKTSPNDRNSNHTQSESSWTSPSSAANNRANSSPNSTYGSHSSPDETNHSIYYASQNNNIYGSSITNGPRNEIIATSPDGRPSTKKRTAPGPPVGQSGKATSPLSVEETNEKNKNDMRRSERLHLDLTRNDPSSKPKLNEEPLGYRDLYFSSSKRRVSGNSPRSEEISSKAETSPSYKDLYASDTSPSVTRPKENEASDVRVPKEETVREGTPPSLRPTREPSPIRSPSKSTPPKPDLPTQQKPITKPTLNFSNTKPRQNNYVSTINVTEDSGYVSEPKRPHETRRTTPVPPLDLSEVTRDRDSNLGLRDKKVKRPAPSGPGKLLIRPASNLVPSGSAQYLDLTKYDDIKSSQMEPAKKLAYFAEDDVPVTNIDDYLGDDVPVTNIDDIAFSPQVSPRTEQDAEDQRRELSKKYEFIGAGVKLKKNLLERTRQTKLHISFNDSATSTYEYPSEQSLLETLPPEPGDFDYPNPMLNHMDNGEPDEVIDLVQPGAPLKSTPGMGSGGVKHVPAGMVAKLDPKSGLASYKTKFAMDYQFGMETNQPPPPQPVSRRPEPEPSPEDLQITPADDEETYTWSDNATTSDMLF